MITKNYKSAVYVSALTFIVVSILCLVVFEEIAEVRQKERANFIQSQYRLIDENIETLFNDAQSSLLLLALTIDNEGNPDNFDSIAHQLLTLYPKFNALQLVRNGIITKVYPTKRHKKALGYNIFADSITALEALKAKNEKRIFYAGPLELKQGGLAIIGRLPIWKNNEFWGFSAVLIDFDTIISTINETINNDLISFQFLKKDPVTNEIKHFTDHDMKKFTNALEHYVHEGNWIIQMKSNQPLFSPTDYLIIFLSGFTIIISLTYFSYQLIQKPARLSHIIEEKTIILKQHEERLQAIIKVLPDMLFVIDHNGIYTDCHIPPDKKTLVPRNEFLNKNISSVMSEDLAGSIKKLIEETLATGEDTIITYEFPAGSQNEFECRIVRLNNKEIIAIERDLSEENEFSKRLKDIAYTQSHAVRGPLARIMGLINLLRDNLVPPEETTPIIQHIIESAEELDEIIHEIVNISTSDIDQ